MRSVFDADDDEKKENFAFDCNIFQNLIVLSSGSVQFEIANRTEV